MVDFLKKYLILETVEQQLVDAINTHHTISLYYHGNKGKTGKRNAKDFTDAGLRYVIPVALGVHKSSGSLVLRGLVTSKGVRTKNDDGGIKRQPEQSSPVWRMFRIDKITSVYEHEDANAINDNMPYLYHYNDKDMSIIYAQADFGKQVEPLARKNTQITIPSKLDKVPTGVKSVLKVPVKEPETPPAKPEITVAKPEIGGQQIKTQPVSIKPETQSTVAPIDHEPIEPEDENKPKPISEWYRWLNKIIKN